MFHLFNMSGEDDCGLCICDSGKRHKNEQRCKVKILLYERWLYCFTYSPESRFIREYLEQRLQKWRWKASRILRVSKPVDRNNFGTVLSDGRWRLYNNYQVPPFYSIKSRGLGFLLTAQTRCYWRLKLTLPSGIITGNWMTYQLSGNEVELFMSSRAPRYYHT